MISASFLDNINKILSLYSREIEKPSTLPFPQKKWFRMQFVYDDIGFPRECARNYKQITCGLGWMCLSVLLFCNFTKAQFLIIVSLNILTNKEKIIASCFGGIKPYI